MSTRLLYNHQPFELPRYGLKLIIQTIQKIAGLTCVKTDINFVSTHHAGPPSNVSLIVHSSQNLTLTWNSPTSFRGQHGLFVAYVVKCWSGERLTATYILENVTEVIIDDCLPYQVYNCCVSLQTTLANSTEICQQQRTFEGGS